MLTPSRRHAVAATRRSRRMRGTVNGIGGAALEKLFLLDSLQRRARA